MLKIRTIYKVTVVTLFFCVFSGNTEETELLKISTREMNGALLVNFQFKGEVPEYDVNYEEQNNIYVMFYEFKECTSEFHPEMKVTRPILHMELEPSKVAGYISTRVYIYLEKKIPVSHDKTTDKLTSTFEWIKIKTYAKPNILKEIDFRANEELSLSVKCSFEAVPQEKFVFLLRDKKKIGVVFHNTTEQKDVLQPMNSSLINKIQTKRGFTSDDAPYSKLIFQSNQELLMDLAEEPERFFMDFYGVSGQNLDALVETRTTGEEVVKYERTGTDPDDYIQEEPKQSGKKKWAYMGMGTALIVGGAFAGYLYFLDGETEKPGPIPPIDISLPSDPE